MFFFWGGGEGDLFRFRNEDSVHCAPNNRINGKRFCSTELDRITFFWESTQITQFGFLLIKVWFESWQDWVQCFGNVFGWFRIVPPLLLETTQNSV